ncbi:MAG: DUF445 domain-containing protein [Bacteroidia bacterium]|nr:DUF445 domain-containing protein [Bacteroidia bacterium]MDW8346151.1 DUF445 domain-containing protein [Bacteroidia bacterium]
MALFLFARLLSYYHLKEFWQAVAAFAEAGMVGALADWYAVTALFKHPLGLKIPHTNLIAVKKQKFAIKMGDFIQQHFLKKEDIVQKVKQLEVSQKLAQWMQDEQNQQKIINTVQKLIPFYFAQINEQELNQKIQNLVIDFIQKPDTENYLYLVIEKIIEEKHHQKLLEIALQAIILQVDDYENRKKIHDKVKKETPLFVPTFIGKIYTDKFLDAIRNLAIDIKNNPNHEVRSKFDQAIAEWLQRSKTNIDNQEKIKQIKQKIVQHPIFQENTSQIWTKIKMWLIEELEKTENQNLIKMQIEKFSKRIMEDIRLSEKIDSWVHTQVVQLVETNQESVKKHVTHTIQSWDAKFLAYQLELEVGKDLQYIRINGTLVGGVIGLTLYFITEFIPQWLQQ